MLDQAEEAAGYHMRATLFEHQTAHDAVNRDVLHRFIQGAPVAGVVEKVRYKAGGVKGNQFVNTILGLLALHAGCVYRQVAPFRMAGDIQGRLRRPGQGT